MVPAGGVDCEGKRLVNGLYGDVYLIGVHPLKRLKKNTIVDVRVIFPESTQNASFESLDALLQHHQALIYQKYKRKRDANRLHLVIYLVTTDKAMGP